MEDLAHLKKELEKSIKESNESAALDVIRALDRVSISVESLGKTKIGLAVGKLRKHDNKSLAAEATKLVVKWKRAVADQTPPRPNFPVSSPTLATRKEATEAPIPPSSANAPHLGRERHIPNEEQDKDPTLPVKKEIPASPLPPPANGRSANTTPKTETKRPPIILNDATRQKCFEMIAEGLGDSQTGEADPFEVAQRVETEMFRVFEGTSANYKAKFRQLFMNLKNPKNPDLRLGVLEGHITPERLCQMTSQELASKELQEQRKALEEACLKEAIRGVPKQATTNMFRCHKCKKRECTYYQMQTRSADEPMTTFVSCTNCNNRWRF